MKTALKKGDRVRVKGMNKTKEEILKEHVEDIYLFTHGTLEKREQFTEAVLKAMQSYADQLKGLRWVKASERLGEFEDSDVPHWKFFHPFWCKIDGKPADRPFFRKDIETGKTVFNYKYFGEYSKDIEETEFDRIEWLDESASQFQSGEQLYRFVKASERLPKVRYNYHVKIQYEYEKDKPGIWNTASLWNGEYWEHPYKYDTWVGKPEKVNVVEWLDENPVIVHEIITSPSDYDRILEGKNREIAELRVENERLKGLIESLVKDSSWRWRQQKDNAGDMKQVMESGWQQFKTENNL